jgi:hypothetical protein
LHVSWDESNLDVLLAISASEAADADTLNGPGSPGPLGSPTSASTPIAASPAPSSSKANGQSQAVADQLDDGSWDTVSKARYVADQLHAYRKRAEEDKALRPLKAIIFRCVA